MDGWLKSALSNDEWVITQRQAWENWSKPEHFGSPAPKFLQITEENLWQLVDQLSRHFREHAERLLEASRVLQKVSAMPSTQDCLSGTVRSGLSFFSPPNDKGERRRSRPARPAG